MQTTTNLQSDFDYLRPRQRSLLFKEGADAWAIHELYSVKRLAFALARAEIPGQVLVFELEQYDHFLFQTRAKIGLLGRPVGQELHDRLPSGPFFPGEVNLAQAALTEPLFDHPVANVFPNHRALRW